LRGLCDPQPLDLARDYRVERVGLDGYRPLSEEEMQGREHSLRRWGQEPERQFEQPPPKYAVNVDMPTGSISVGGIPGPQQLKQ